MQQAFNPSPEWSLVLDLLQVPMALCEQRYVVSHNRAFADLFGYGDTDLRGMSLERVYPNRREFIERGNCWREFMANAGLHSDERLMLCRNDEPIWLRVTGRCQDRLDPYRLTAVTFERASPARLRRGQLTARERSVIDAMSEGLTSKEIARRLNLSHRTIETYRSRLMVKTGARNASQLLSLIR